MLKHEKLPSTNPTKSGAHYNFAKFQENEHIPDTLPECDRNVIERHNKFTDFSTIV